MDKDWFGALVAYLLGATVLALILFCVVLSQSTELSSLRSQAILRGYAEYGSDKNGNPVWQWKVIPGGKVPVEKPDASPALHND